MAGNHGISLSIGQFAAQQFERIGLDHFRVGRIVGAETRSNGRFPRAFPGVFGNQAEQLTQIIHQIFLSCLSDAETKVRYTAATALAAYLKHNSDNTQLLNVYRDCLTPFIAVRSIEIRRRKSMIVSLPSDGDAQFGQFGRRYRSQSVDRHRGKSAEISSTGDRRRVQPLSAGDATEGRIRRIASASRSGSLGHPLRNLQCDGSQSGEEIFAATRSDETLRPIDWGIRSSRLSFSSSTVGNDGRSGRRFRLVNERHDRRRRRRQVIPPARSMVNLHFDPFQQCGGRRKLVGPIVLCFGRKNRAELHFDHRANDVTESFVIRSRHG